MMDAKQMKELYASGDWIAVWYNKNRSNSFWSKNDQDGKTFRWHDTTVLIHKKHAKVLDHVLTGGKVFLLGYESLDKKYHNKVVVLNFIEEYESTAIYEIIKEKSEWVFGSLEDTEEGITITAKPYNHFSEVVKQITSRNLGVPAHVKPKQVERITREDMFEALLSNLQDPKLFTQSLEVRLKNMLSHIADRMEYLEANQKG